MAYILNPIDNNPLAQKFPVEYDEFEGLMPKAIEKLNGGEKFGVPAEEVVVSQFDLVYNGDEQMEVVDIQNLASEDGE